MAGERHRLFERIKEQREIIKRLTLYYPPDGGGRAHDARMNIRRAFEQLDALGDSEPVKKTAPLYKEGHPLPSSTIQVGRDLNTELLAYVKKHPETVHNMTPRQFEKFVAEILASHGYTVTLSSQTRDGGHDIFAVNKNTSGLEAAWIVECKKYREDRKVGLSIVRSVYGLIADLRVNRALVATTSHFSRDA